MPKEWSSSRRMQVDEADRMRARLVLAATRPPDREAQVPIDDLIALREGTLSADSRERVLQILDSCPECYEDWIALNRFLDDEESGSNARRGVSAVRGLPLGGKLTIAATAAVVILAAVVSMLLVPASDVGTSIEQAFESAVKYSLLPAQPGGVLVLGETVYAFGGPEEDAVSRTAFAAGVWQANHALQGGDIPAYPKGLLPPRVATASFDDRPWQNTKWSVYTDTGRWLVLVVEVCKGPGYAYQPFWQDQREVFARIKTALTDVEEREGFRRVVSERLDRMGNAYDQLARGNAAGRSCAVIEREVRGLLGSAGKVSD